MKKLANILGYIIFISGGLYGIYCAYLYITYVLRWDVLVCLITWPIASILVPWAIAFKGNLYPLLIVYGSGAIGLILMNIGKE